MRLVYLYLYGHLFLTKVEPCRYGHQWDMIKCQHWLGVLIKRANLRENMSFLVVRTRKTVCYMQVSVKQGFAVLSTFVVSLWGRTVLECIHVQIKYFCAPSLVNRMFNNQTIFQLDAAIYRSTKCSTDRDYAHERTVLVGALLVGDLCDSLCKTVKCVMLLMLYISIKSYHLLSFIGK